MLNTPFAPWPSFSNEEVDAAAEVLRSGRVNYWTGDEGRSFEREFAEAMGTGHAIALMNGTVALDLALRGLGIGPGDEVIVTPRTFIASVSCVINAGAVPVFADVDADSGNISAATIAPVLTQRTRAILCVHLAGWPCDMTAIMDLAAAHSLLVIEDCAQAHGARHRGQNVGTFGNINCWSFCQDKIMTTGGEGGMVATNDRDAWSRMWSYKDHGKSWEAVFDRDHPAGFRWLHESFGTNWRMLEMQAAIGRIQLRTLEESVAIRARNAKALTEVTRRFDGALRTPWPGNEETHAFYRLQAYVRPDGLRSGWSRDRIIEEIKAAGGWAMSGSCSEVYREKAFDGTEFRPPEALPVARKLGETSLAFLTHPTLTDNDIDRMRGALERVLADASA